MAVLMSKRSANKLDGFFSITLYNDHCKILRCRSKGSRRRRRRIVFNGLRPAAVAGHHRRVQYYTSTAAACNKIYDLFYSPSFSHSQSLSLPYPHSFFLTKLSSSSGVTLSKLKTFYIYFFFIPRALLYLY